jgi:hypothetical protein
VVDIEIFSFEVVIEITSWAWLQQRRIGSAAPMHRDYVYLESMLCCIAVREFMIPENSAAEDSAMRRDHVVHLNWLAAPLELYETAAIAITYNTPCQVRK